MQQSEFDLYLDRAKCFYNRLEHNLVFSEMILEAQYHQSKVSIPFPSWNDVSCCPIKEGEQWGDPWDIGLFHISGKIPKSWDNQSVVMILNFNGEALIFDDAGCPLYGLSAGSIFHENYTKEIYPLSEAEKTAGQIDCWVEASATNLFGMKMDRDPALNCPYPKGNYKGILNKCRLGLFDDNVWHLRTDIEILLSLINTMSKNDYRIPRILNTISQAVNIFSDNPANAAAARESLQAVLEHPAYASAMKVTSVGHAHIDTAWLWPVRESVRKCARTFANQIDLLNKYPDYVFGASQAQHYQFIKDKYPALYQKIRKYVKAGRWEIQGGMWVEADCNLINGESMVRQFLYGKNFFMDEFGFEPKSMWLPDVFGYSAALPQIIKKSGCDYFLTTKMAWNKYNTFPYSTFNWIGIDGTEVLAHMPPEGTYNAKNIPEQLVSAQGRMNENHIIEEFISLFGIGNGGGGPKAEYVERGLRLENLEGVPKVKFGRSDEFFERLCKAKEHLPVWNGELYLELHRGTFTSQARTKRGNRKLEQQLLEAEFICSCLPLAQYPQAGLDSIWKGVLLNQFHDIIPGSSISEVYETAERDYNELSSKCSELVNNSIAPATDDCQNVITLINTLSYFYKSPVILPGREWANSEITDSSGNIVPTQTEGDKTYLLVTIPASSLITLHKGGTIRTDEVQTDNKLTLENDLIRYSFDKNGQVTEIFDKESCRNLLSENDYGNVLSLYIDRPNNWEAWDIDEFYVQERQEDAVSVSPPIRTSGTIKQSIVFTLQIGKSNITQKVTLVSGSKLLAFDTVVDWKESRRMLRVAFPVNIFSTEAIFDIQYGYVKRDIHKNTSWDAAKFEVCAQRYADLSEADYGVALLNDCKYGHNINNGVLDLCLLRSSKYPDWNADQGKHEFSYGLYPHANGFMESDVIAVSATFNRSPKLVNGDCGRLQIPCRIESDSIVLEVVKKAEKEDRLVIRLVETKGKKSTGSLILNFPGGLTETNLLEWENLSKLEPVNGRVDIAMKPFEIKTYKLKINKNEK